MKHGLAQKSRILDKYLDLMLLYLIILNGAYNNHDTFPRADHPQSLILDRNHLHPRQRWIIKTHWNKPTSSSSSSQIDTFLSLTAFPKLLWRKRTLKSELLTEQTEQKGAERENRKFERRLKQHRRDGICLKAPSFSFATLYATFLSIQGGLFLNNPTLGFHHSFEMIHVPLSNICLLF